MTVSHYQLRAHLHPARKACSHLWSFLRDNIRYKRTATSQRVTEQKARVAGGFASLTSSSWGRNRSFRLKLFLNHSLHLKSLKNIPHTKVHRRSNSEKGKNKSKTIYSFAFIKNAIEYSCVELRDKIKYREVRLEEANLWVYTAAIRVCWGDCKHRGFSSDHYRALYEPPEHHESQLNHLQPINWNANAGWSTVF